MDLFDFYLDQKKSDRPINTTGIDKTHLKRDCISRSIFNGIREPIWYIFALDRPPRYKRYKERRIKLSKEIKKSVSSHISFYLEVDD